MIFVLVIDEGIRIKNRSRVLLKSSRKERSLNKMRDLLVILYVDVQALDKLMLHAD